MKKILILFLILLIPSALALEANLKSEYNPGETLVAEISGNFIEPIKAENVLFYSGRAYIGMVYDVAKVQNKLYLYAILPNKERNYTLIIEDVKYLEAGQEKTEDLIYNFSVKGSVVEFSVNPGFIITNKDFNLKIQSNYNSEIKSEFLNSTETISVSVGQEKTISFSVKDITNFTITSIKLSTNETQYNIPVIVYKYDEQKQEEDIDESRELRFLDSYYNFSVLKDSDFKYQITLLNTGQEAIEDIEFSIDSSDIILKPEVIEKLEAGDLIKINLTINFREVGIEEYTLSVSAENISLSTIISIETFENSSELEEKLQDSEVIGDYTCEDYKGTKCAEGESCDGTIVTTIEGSCCVGECVEKKTDSAGKIIALIIILVILGGIGFFVYKKLKSKKQNSGEVLKQKSDRYQGRFKPQEIKGSLDRG